MSSDPRFILDVIPPGSGWVLDLGGGKGMLRRPLIDRGYRYFNLDIQGFGNGEPSIVGDGRGLPPGQLCGRLPYRGP